MAHEYKIDYRANFERQRRGFFLSCVIMGLYLILDLKLTVLNIAGNVFTITKPNGVEVMIWCLVVYFALRYSQYLYQCRRTISGDIQRDALTLIKDGVSKEALVLCIKRDHPKTKKQNPDGSNFKYKISHSEVLAKGDLGWEVELILKVSSNTSDGVSVQTIHPIAIAVSGYRLWRRKADAILTVLVATTYGTEYLLPYILLSLVIGLKVFW